MKVASLAVALTLSVAFPAPLLHAERAGKMNDPDLLPDVRNKIVVLEFANPEGKWGLELSEVLSREMIGSIRGISSVGVLNLRQDERHIDLNVSNVTEIAHKQNALIVVWGESYESGDKIYLHSHLRIVPDAKNAKSPLALALKTRGGLIKATPPSLLVNFEPIELNTRSLEGIKESHRQTGAIRADPRVDAQPLGNLQTEDGFDVEDVQGPWMRIKTQKGVSGWVQYAALEGQRELGRLQAMISFANAALQYSAGNFEAAQGTISAYLTRWGENQDKANLALAHILLGNARFEARTRESARDAAREYLKAAELLPNAAAPANYLAVARLREFEESGGYVPEMRDLETRMIRAVQAQNDSQTLDNLRVLYQCASGSKFLQRDGMSGELYSDTIARQLTLIEQIAPELKR